MSLPDTTYTDLYATDAGTAEETVDVNGDDTTQVDAVAELEVDSDSEDDTDGEPRGVKTRKTRTASAELSKAQVRRIAMRTLALFEADEDDLGLLATVYGVSADPVSLTVDTIVEGAAAFKAADPLLKILSAEDPFEAMMTALGLDEQELKTTWSLARGLGVDLPPRVPGNDNKACKELAQSLSVADSDAILSRLDAARDLLK